MAFFVLERDRLTDMRREARMAPGEKLSGQLLGDGTAFDETGEQALAQQLHHRVSVPRLARVKRAIVREGAVGHNDVSHEDDDARPSVRSHPYPHVLGEGLRGALREVEQKLSSPSEDPAQEARHGENDLSMRDGLEHFFLQPLGT
jgi:hypothetical protein